MGIELFADHAGLASSPSTVRIILKDQTNMKEVKAIIILPPSVAKELALMIRHDLKALEWKTKTTFQVSDGFMERVGVIEDDW